MCIRDSHDDMWAVPKSLIIYDDTKDWIDTSIEARGIKLKITKIGTFVNPKVPIPFRIENLTGINDNMVLDAPDIETVLPKFLEFSEGARCV